MLLELRIENLLLIDRAELRPGRGLNAITGETGAGKTVLAHALDLLLGGKPRAGIVRPGAPEAYVEGVFDLPDGLLDSGGLVDLRERLADHDGEVVLARRVTSEGRTRAYVQGRSATAGDLRELGGRLLSFFGQHEHRRLTVASVQLDLLDSFCGAEHVGLRERVGGAHSRVRRLESELEELRARAGTRDRDLDLLRFEIDEIEALGPSEEEERSLMAERERQRRVDGLRAAAAAAGHAISPADPDVAGSASGFGSADRGFAGGASGFGSADRGFAGGASAFGPADSGVSAGAPGVAALLAEAERFADAVAGADPELDSLAERVRALRLEAEDLGGELWRYLAGLDSDPARLHEVGQRLDEYDRVKRKHGGSVAAVLTHAERCVADRDRLENAEVELECAEKELSRALSERAKLAGRLTTGREAAAPRLAERVAAELSSLAMEGATFAVELEPRGEVGALGAERLEFMLAPNPGVPAAPVRESASGGELSRVMLALLTAASTAADAGSAAAAAEAGGQTAPTLVFDEVDAGVGGQTARAVAARLRALGGGRQVLCITHLPQIAALAERHFRIVKSSTVRSPSSRPARASVERIEDASVVEELCRMLGADTSDAGARRHAEELLAAA